MLKKAYFEITNACNLTCDFCHGTKRPIRYVSADEFAAVTDKLKDRVEYLYFHLMGEPLLHPRLGEFLQIAGEKGFRVILTTNGTLLRKCGEVLFGAKALHKVSISLHCYEANKMGIGLDEYLESCFEFCRVAAKNDIISVMRLGNEGGKDDLNEYILGKMREYFGTEWKEIYSGYKLCHKVFIEWGQKFDWPDVDGMEVEQIHSCYGLRDQVGILSDGRVVPCCLDAEGTVTLGNIFEEDLDAILQKPRALALRRSFEVGNVTEKLCRRCGYAMRYGTKG